MSVIPQTTFDTTDRPANELSPEQLSAYLERTSLGAHMESGYEMILSSLNVGGWTDRFELVKDDAGMYWRRLSGKATGIQARRVVRGQFLGPI